MQDFYNSINRVLLWICYLHLPFAFDLPFASNFETTLFADDTNLHISHHDIHVLQSQIKQKVNKINNWMLYNKLSINYKKSCFILVTKKPINSFNFKVSINHNHVQKTEYVKYLGIYVDNKLSWKVQIDKLYSKISKVCGMN